MVNYTQVKDRMINYGIESFSDIEALSILLSLKTDPRGFHNLAGNLIDCCGSFNGVINAAREGPPAFPNKFNPNIFGLRLPHEITDKYLKTKINTTRYLDNPDNVIEYLKHSMQGLPVEQFRVLYLNGRNQIINEEYQTNGTVCHASVYPREVVKTALRYNSSAMILAHNHPSGNLQPSRDDIKLTDRIYSAAKLFDIAIHDHLIITNNGYFSFADKNLIPNFNIYQHLNSK